MNVTAYVNGKRVTEEEISKIKIHSDVIDRIVAEIKEKRRKMEVVG